MHFASRLALDPRNEGLTQQAAWFLVFCPDPRFHDPARALVLARRLDKMVPRIEGNRRHLQPVFARFSPLVLRSTELGTSMRPLKQ